MPRAFEEYAEDNQGKLKQAFDKINPDYWNKIQNNSDAIDNVKDIMADAEKLRQDIELSHAANRPDKIEQAQKTIREDRSKWTTQVSPQVRDHLLSHDAILHEARRTVRLQEEAELSRIDKFVEDNIREIANQALPQSQTEQEIPHMSDQEKQTHLKAEIHAAIDNSVKARMQVGMTMNRERERMLEEAKQNGSQNPHEDVRAVQKAMYTSVDEKLHKDIHAAFVKYGYDADHKQVSFIAETGEYQGMEGTKTEDQTISTEAEITQSNQSDDYSQ